MIWLNTLIAHLIPFLPKSFVGLMARQYIAGETLEDAITATRSLNREGVQVTLDLLGEDPESGKDCTNALAVYQEAIKTIKSQGLLAGISLKPSQMGLKLDRDFCLSNIRKLVKMASGNDIFVRIDMEDASLCDATLGIFLSLANEFSNVGIVIQAYLRRSMEDTAALAEKRANVRLCKGAYYWEDRKTVYKDKEIVNQSYTCLLETLLSANCFVGIATHDEKLVFQGLRLVNKMGLSRGDYEFQMLYGVDGELQKILVDAGHPMRVYLPFGKDWFAYSVRRLKENPMIVGYILTRGIKMLGEVVRGK